MSKENFYLGFMRYDESVEYYYNNPDRDYGVEMVTIEVYDDNSGNVIVHREHGVDLSFLRKVLKHFDEEIENNE